MSMLGPLFRLNQRTAYGGAGAESEVLETPGLLAMPPNAGQFAHTQGAYSKGIIYERPETPLTNVGTV